MPTLSPETRDVVEREDAQALEVLPPSAAEQFARAEIDVLVATAKQYPRSFDRFQRMAIAMATIDEETAESCLYRRPVGKKKANGRWQEEYAEGLSIRMAEIVGAAYGNLRVYATLVEQAEGYVRARGMAIDLETNFASSSEVIEATLKQDGTPFSPRMRVVVAKAALAKARRDATFQVVPKALAKPIESAVRRVLLGTAETLEKRRQSVAAWMAKIGIDPARVYAALGIAGPADLQAAQLETLTGLRTALKDGEIALDEAFPLVLPQPAQRITAPTPAASEAPSAPAAPQAPAPAPATATPAYVGIVTDVVETPGGTLITLSTGWRGATKHPAIIAAAKDLREHKTRVEIVSRPARDPKHAPVIEELLPQPEEG